MYTFFQNLIDKIPHIIGTFFYVIGKIFSITLIGLCSTLGVIFSTFLVLFVVIIFIAILWIIITYFLHFMTFLYKAGACLFGKIKWI